MDLFFRDEIVVGFLIPAWVTDVVILTRYSRQVPCKTSGTVKAG